MNENPLKKAASAKKIAAKTGNRVESRESTSSSKSDNTHSHNPAIKNSGQSTRPESNISQSPHIEVKTIDDKESSENGEDADIEIDQAEVEGLVSISSKGDNRNVEDINPLMNSRTRTKVCPAYSVYIISHNFSF
jgi:hypothetical protein